MERPATPDDGWLMFAFAHDLRGYLRATLTRIQMVQAGSAALLPEQERAFLEQAVTSARDMEGLIAAMVAYTDAGKPGPETMRLPLLLRGVLLEIKSVLAEAGGAVSVTNDADVTVPLALQAVMKELLANACKFRRRDAKLEIQIRTQLMDAATIAISVLDNGTGVEPALLDKLFVPFRRMHSRSDYPGYGLGIARCRRIVEARGGTISAAVPPGGGFAVTVSIPVVT